MNRKGKRMKDPLGGRGYKYITFLMAVYQIWYIFIWKFEGKPLSLPKKGDYGSIKFHIERVSE